MKLRTSLLSGIFIFLLMIGSVFLLFAREPERHVLVSEDGRMEMRGDFRRIQEPKIELVDPVQTLSPHALYLISPAEVGLEAPVRLSMSLVDVENSPNQSFITYDETTRMWRRLEASEHTQEAIVVETERLGLFGIAELPEHEAPEDARVHIDHLIAQAPESTVGFRIVYGYQRGEDGVVIQFSQGVLTGGCGGIIERGNGEQLLTHVTSGVAYVAQWFVSSLGGCEEGVVLEPFDSVL